MDDELGELRRDFCRTAARSLRNVAGWLGIDAVLGGGDLQKPDDVLSKNPDRHMGFRATAVVIEMASELVSGAIREIDDDRRFAASALIRQLLESEYLLRAFGQEFSQASKWARSSSEDIRRLFRPATMRQIGGFSNTEYWNHCDMGGHPSPRGRVLLRYSPAVPKDEAEMMAASIWGDLAQHLRRLWLTTDELLVREHARYESVRSCDRDPVNELIELWDDRDPLSRTTDFQLLESLLDSEIP